MRQETTWRNLGKVVALGRPYWPRIVCAITLSLASVAAALVLPLGVRALMDGIVRRPGTSFVNRLAIGLLSLFIARAFLRCIGGYMLRAVGERVVADLRIRVYSHLQHLQFSFFHSNSTGDLTSRLTNDVASVRTAATDAVASALLQSARLIGSVAVMADLNWRLCALVLVAIPVATVAGQYFGDRLRRLARRVQDCLASATAIATEAFSGLRVVKSFGREDYEIERYRAAIERVYSIARQSALGGSVCASSIEFAFVAITVGIFWYGGHEVLAGRVSAGDLVAFLFYSQNISQSIAELTSLYTLLLTAAGASERLFEILATPCESDAAKPAAQVATDGRISLQHVSFGYGPETVLSDINLEISAGEVVALIGVSGAGKSTLFSLLPRLYEPTSGRILIGGVDAAKLTLRSLRDSIAYVTQDVELFNTSIRENIRYGRLDATDEEIEHAARAANAHQFITELPAGYDTEVGERGMRLSGGQRQRISITRALLKNAPILLLDEAMSSVDAFSENLIQQSLEGIRGKRTILIIAHQLRTVANADRVVVLEGGRVVEAGTQAELREREGLYRLLMSREYQYVYGPKSETAIA